MEREEVVAKLKALREELEEDGVNILYMPVTAGMFLSDICGVLGLTAEEHNEVMGKEAAEAIEEWKTARLWQPAEKETATVPLPELAAVPA
jgi:hypothetical protein